VSGKLVEYFKKKYCDVIALVGLLKACSIVSSKLEKQFNVFVIAPTRQFKSRSSEELLEAFPKGKKSMILDVGSDFTIHSLNEQFKGIIPPGCLMINDLTLLMSSKGKRTKDRLFGGLAELMSEGRYQYGDRQSQFILKGHPSLICNMTAESYQQNKETMEISTFLERMLTIYYFLSEDDMKTFFMDKKDRKLLKFDDKTYLKVKKFKPVNIDEFRFKIFELGSVYSCLGVCSLPGMLDNLENLVIAHAFLNGRDNLCEDDILLLEILKSFINNPYAKNEGKIVELWEKKMSVQKIMMYLGIKKTSQDYVYRVIRKAKLRGHMNNDGES
jgi:hypothetical protein